MSFRSRLLTAACAFLIVSASAEAENYSIRLIWGETWPAEWEPGRACVCVLRESEQLCLEPTSGAKWMVSPKPATEYQYVDTDSHLGGIWRAVSAAAGSAVWSEFNTSKAAPFESSVAVSLMKVASKSAGLADVAGELSPEERLERLQRLVGGPPRERMLPITITRRCLGVNTLTPGGNRVSLVELEGWPRPPARRFSDSVEIAIAGTVVQAARPLTVEADERIQMGSQWVVDPAWRVDAKCTSDGEALVVSQKIDDLLQSNIRWLRAVVLDSLSDDLVLRSVLDLAKASRPDPEVATETNKRDIREQVLRLIQTDNAFREEFRHALAQPSPVAPH